MPAITRSTQPLSPIVSTSSPNAQSVMRVLIIASSEEAATIGACLRAPGGYTPDAVIEHERRIGRACERLARERFDVVMLDLSQPGASGPEGVEALCVAAPDVPVVVMTSATDHSLAVAAVKAG